MSCSGFRSAVLHIVVRPPWSSDALPRALAHWRSGDVLLLAQEAVAAACAEVPIDCALASAMKDCGVKVLAYDLAARGFMPGTLRPGAAVIDDATWVDTVVSCQRSVTWS